MRHRIGIRRIENGRWQRRGRRHIPRLCVCIFDEEPGSKHDCASAQPNRFKSARRHLRSPLRALFRWHQLITSSQHCLSRNRGAEARSHPVSALAQETAELARATCRRFQAASFDSTRKRPRAIRRYNKDRRLDLPAAPTPERPPRHRHSRSARRILTSTNPAEGMRDQNRRPARFCASSGFRFARSGERRCPG